MTSVLDCVALGAWLWCAARAVPRAGARVEHAAIALLLALGLSSAAWFATRALLGRGTAASLVEVAAALAAAAVVSQGTRRDPGPKAPTSSPRAPLPRVLVAVFAATVCAAVVAFCLEVARDPHGGWDAWAIWNLRARFLAADGDGWPRAFVESATMTHVDYPLLLPASIARVWSDIDSRPIAVPIGVALLFPAVAIALLVAAVARTRGAALACVAGSVVAGTPLFVRNAAAQYADVAVGTFLLALAIAVERAAHDAGRRSRWLAVAGALAACLAWTKNEGLLLAACASVSAWLGFARGTPARARVRTAGACLLGALPVALCVLWFKLAFAGRNDVVDAGILRVGGLVDPQRLTTIAVHTARELASFGNGLLAAIAAVALATRWLSPASSAPRRSAATRFVAVVLVLALLGELVVYAITPQPLAWHLASSQERLLLQLWPSFLLWLFLSVRDPWAARSTPA